MGNVAAVYRSAFINEFPFWNLLTFTAESREERSNRVEGSRSRESGQGRGRERETVDWQTD